MFEDIPLNRYANIEKLFTVSWINGYFSAWIGSPEKNRAWELLFQTKRDFLHYRSGLSKDQTDAIENHFLSAECSVGFGGMEMIAARHLTWNLINFSESIL